MKNIRSLFHGLIVCGVAAGMVSFLAAQPANPSAAKVIRLVGHAQYSTDNSTWHDLSRGDLVKPGTVIRTAANSRVDFALGEPEAPIARPAAGEMLAYQPQVQQNILRIWQNSIVSIDRLNVTQTGTDEVSETQLDLRAGHIFGKVKRMSPASSYDVKIPNGVASIRGTIYDLTAEGVLQVLTGAVLLKYNAPDGTPKTQTVTTDQQFDARTGELSTLPNPIKENLLTVAMEAKVGSFPSNPYTYTADQTQYYVSPTTGGK